MYIKTVSFLIFCSALIFSQCSKNNSEDPVPRDPDVPGEYFAYIKNYSDKMWIGTYSDSIANKMKSVTGTDNQLWIGGGVIPDSNMKYGFYFDPNTVLMAEATVEGMQITIQQISQDPVYYQNNGWPNGLTDHAWYVKAKFLVYRE
ncbi:MAG: hypothetical protein ACQERS_14135 [Bacteroidota bacterium]